MTEVIISAIDKNIESLRFLKETVRENCGTPVASAPPTKISRFKIQTIPTSPEANKIITEISNIIVKLNELKFNVSSTCNSSPIPEVVRPLPTTTGEKRGRFTIKNIPNTEKGGKTKKHKKSNKKSKRRN
jgi:hypothetical protein